MSAQQNKPEKKKPATMATHLIGTDVLLANCADLD